MLLFGAFFMYNRMVPFYASAKHHPPGMFADTLSLAGLCIII